MRRQVEMVMQHRRKKTARMGIRVDPELHDQFAALCAHLDVDKSIVCRDLMREAVRYMDRYCRLRGQWYPPAMRRLAQ